MENNRSKYKDVLYLAVGEILAALAVVAVYAFIDALTYKVLLGAALGAAVAVFNFLYLSISVNRAVDKFMKLRGEREMDEEEAEKFASEHVGEIQNAQKLSYIVRTFTLLGALVLAFLSKQFDVIATAVPLLLFQPILVVTQNIAQRRGE
jgi:hypothetical protein